MNEEIRYADNHLTKAVLSEMKIVSDEFELEVNLNDLVIHSSNNTTIGFAPCKNLQLNSIEELATKRIPLFIFYLDLPKERGIPRGVYIAKSIEGKENLGLFDCEDRQYLKGSYYMKAGGEFAGGGCSLDRTGWLIDVCCIMGITGPVKINSSLCLILDILGQGTNNAPGSSRQEAARDKSQRRIKEGEVVDL